MERVLKKLDFQCLKLIHFVIKNDIWFILDKNLLPLKYFSSQGHMMGKKVLKTSSQKIFVEKSDALKPGF